MDRRESKEYHVTLWYCLVRHFTVCYSMLQFLTACYIVVLLVTLRYCFFSLVTVCDGLLQYDKPQKIDFAQTFLFGRVISPKNCYFFKYCAIVEKNANFEPEPNFGGPSPANRAFNRPKSTNNLFEWPFLCRLYQFDKGYLTTSFRDNFFFR